MAGITNQYPNLPGHLVEFKDGGMSLRNNDSTSQSDSVILLGTSMDGPVMEPVAIDVETVEALFGKEIDSNGAPNGSTLVRDAKALADGGVTDIRCMRITGSTAKTNINKTATTVDKQVPFDEELKRVDGNDITTLHVKNVPIVPTSAKVFAKGTLLSTGVLVNETTGEITITENTCDAGSNLQVEYDYNRIETVTDESKILDSGCVIELTYKPFGPVSLTVGGVAIDSANYTVTDKVIHVDRYDASNPANVGDEVKASYSGITSDVYHATETTDGTNPFVSATSVQDMTLTETPASGTFHLYVDGIEDTDTLSYSIDATLKVVHIKKEYFPRGSLITAGYNYHKAESVTETIHLESYFGGEVYNKGTVAVRKLMDAAGTSQIGILVEITKPIEKRSQVTETPLQYNSIEYPTFEQLVNAINNDPNNGVYKASTDYPASLTADLLVNVTPVNVIGDSFIGGNNGVTTDKEVLFKALSGERDADGYLLKSGAYQLLEDYQVDWVIPCGVYADDVLSDKYSNFAYELALFCAVSSYTNKITLGAIDTKPCVDTSLAGIKDYAEHLVNISNIYLMKDQAGNVITDDDNNPIDLGRFISVVAGPNPLYTNKNLGKYYGSSAVAYTALNSILNPQSAPTNKKMVGTKGIKFRFSNKQHNAIAGNRIITFKTKFDKAGATLGEAYVVDGMTSSAPGSDYARLTTTKVLRETINHVREVSEPFIGEPNTTEQRNALGATVSKRLNILKERGVILDYEFAIVATIEDQILGQAKIELTIVAPQELRKITTVVGLKA